MNAPFIKFRNTVDDLRTLINKLPPTPAGADLLDVATLIHDSLVSMRDLAREILLAIEDD